MLMNHIYCQWDEKMRGILGFVVYCDQKHLQNVFIVLSLLEVFFFIALK